MSNAASPADENRTTTPSSSRFIEHISSGWAPRTAPMPTRSLAAQTAARHRRAVSAAFSGIRLVIPAGPAKTRSNDTEYPYRAHSAFTQLTGWGAATVPDAVLVLEPRSGGADGKHDPTLYFRAPAGRTTKEFYEDTQIGEFWVGARPGLAEVSALLGLASADLPDLDEVLVASDTPIALVRDADPQLTRRVDALRAGNTAEPDKAERDQELAQWLAEARLVKDDYEVGQIRQAIAATKQGFDDVLAALPRAQQTDRGERLIEGVFFTRARLAGNDIGYGSIVAAGEHATTLHWMRNDGAVRPDDLVLLDAGVELESYFTADITRTFPVSGTFSPIQAKIYQAVLDAADAAFRVVRPGAIFRDIHAAAMRVIAERTAEWGLLPVSAEASLEPDNQFHRRYMVHGTSHHLGIDVHDCAEARRALYMDGELATGMVFTIEPGLYFQPDDLTVPEEYRGIGIRIEDNVLVTETGAENLSAGIPRTLAAVEAWVRDRRG